ncbi:MAG: hypothetical protein HC854_17885 [Flavobacterium sp.]|nr:hypothetical protein [Flavobacterium sp.]
MKRFINFCFLTILMISCVSKKVEISKDYDSEAFFNDQRTINYIIGDNFFTSDFNSKDFGIVDEVLNRAISEDKFYFLKDKNIIELKKYYRQYLVYTDKNNDKWIYINAMCRVSDDLNWKKKCLKYQMVENAIGILKLIFQRKHIMD